MLPNPIPQKDKKPGGTIHLCRISSCAPGFYGVLNVKTHTKRAPKPQPVSDLPLFNWRVVVLHPSTRAGQFVARRYRVHAACADLVASLAGIGSGVQQ
jgi:hypothetical protein